MTKPVPVQAVKKALDLLSILAFEDVRREGLSLSELAKKMGLLPNSTHNLLKTMSQCGFVQQTSEGHYLVGAKCLQMGRINTITSPIVIQILRQALQALSQKINETVVFITLVNGRRMPIMHVDSQQAIRIHLEQMANDRFFDLPTGRILAAYASHEELGEIIEKNGLPGNTWDNCHDQASFHQLLWKVREAGHVLIPKDRSEVTSFACPVPNTDKGKIFGALGCFSPCYRCDETKQQKILAALKLSAEQIASQLADHFSVEPARLNSNLKSKIQNPKSKLCQTVN
ncbi:MAG: helix-turn-helix domain-containing protein [Verrucomicrobiae bacterium]|nr:helix-turn-helix domain-containing protein [Verrucomicrobiae bacterium]